MACKLSPHSPLLSPISEDQFQKALEPNYKLNLKSIQFVHVLIAMTTVIAATGLNARIVFRIYRFRPNTVNAYQPRFLT